MIRSEVISLAKQAEVCDPSPYSMPWEHQIQALERFATLVAAAEREACAKLCEKPRDSFVAMNPWNQGYDSASRNIAAAIRARNESPKNEDHKGGA